MCRRRYICSTVPAPLAPAVAPVRNLDGERWTIGPHYSSSSGNSGIGASRIALGCIWPHITGFSANCSVMTLNRARRAGPNAVEIATSAASLPRALQSDRFGAGYVSHLGHTKPRRGKLQPRAEIHWGWVRWHAYIPQIARAIAGRDVHASAERYSEMGEVPTYADTLLMSFPRGPVIPGILISELNTVVNVLAYRSRSRPTALDVPKQRPGMVR